MELALKEIIVSRELNSKDISINFSIHSISSYFGTNSWKTNAEIVFVCEWIGFITNKIYRFWKFIWLDRNWPMWSIVYVSWNSYKLRVRGKPIKRYMGIWSDVISNAIGWFSIRRIKNNPKSSIISKKRSDKIWSNGAWKEK